MSLFLKHMLWTTLCPGTVTLLLPWLMIRPEWRDLACMRPECIIGLILICVGYLVLGSCIFMFARFGKGTLSPFDPARNLVISGLYKYLRNPMYVGVMIVLLGEALLLWSGRMVVYGVIVFALFNVFIIFYEEPYLFREFGEQYLRYKQHVRRWLPGKPYASR